MNAEKTGALLRRLRLEKQMTQRQLAQLLCISEQAVSKWERGVGMPDVSFLPQLAEIFSVSTEKLLSGSLETNEPEGGNMKRLKFYVCPDCGNVMTAASAAELTCCGRRLQPLEVHEGDEAHTAQVELIEDDWYVTWRHPMEKDHFFRFAAYVGSERVLLVRLYPEQGGEVRIPRMSGGRLYLCCSRHGLFPVGL